MTVAFTHRKPLTMHRSKVVDSVVAAAVLSRQMDATSRCYGLGDALVSSFEEEAEPPSIFVALIT